MDLYLTPAQFRALNLGVDVTGWIDAELAPILARSTADVNTYCAVPLIPVEHSFLGGAIVGETHTWRTDPYAARPTRRLFPYHKPVIAVTSMRLYATLTQYLDFSASELHYEESEGWVEPASANLTSYGLFGSAVLPWVGLSEPYAQLSYTYGKRTAETVRLFYQGEGGTTWRAATGFWDTPTIVVHKNGSTVNSADYTINRVEGTITWTANVPNGTDLIEADVVSKLDYNISLATGLIAAQRISDRQLTADGFPLGIRSLRVAEVGIDRETRRSSRGSLAEEPTIPPQAADLLDAYVFRALAFA